MDIDHGLYEAVQFCLGLTFGGLHHQCAMHRETQCRGVEAIIHQTLGYISLRDFCHGPEFPAVEDHLVGNETFRSRVEYVIIVLQRGRHVIGIEDGNPGCLGQPRGSQQTDIGVGYGQDAGTSERCSGNGRNALNASGFHQGMGRQEVDQVVGHPDGPDTRATSSMGDGKGFMQVQVAHIGPDISRTGQSHLGVHIGPVHINLSAVLMHHIDDLQDVVFKNPVGGRVGDHDGSKVTAVDLSQFFKVGCVNIAFIVTVHHLDLHAGHYG